MTVAARVADEVVTTAAARVAVVVAAEEDGVEEVVVTVLPVALVLVAVDGLAATAAVPTTLAGSTARNDDWTLVMSGRGAEEPDGWMLWLMPMLSTLSVMVYDCGTAFRSAHWKLDWLVTTPRFAPPRVLIRHPLA